MAKKVATRRELLVRWRGIEEVIGDGGDDVLPDTPKRRRLQRLKEDWFSDAFNFLIDLPSEDHIWCGSWELMGPLLETFYNYSTDESNDSPLKLLWKRMSVEMRKCTLCISQHHQAQDMYSMEYDSSSISPLLSVLRSLDEERVGQHLKEINARLAGGEYIPERDNAEVVSVMFEVLTFPCLFDDQSLVTEFQIFIETIDDKHELTLEGHQQYPGVYALFFFKRRVRTIGHRLAGYLGKLREATELEPLQPFLKKCIGLLETDVLPSTFETSRPRVQLERISVWLGIKALLGFLEPPALEEGILERYPIFFSIVLNHISDDSLEFSHAVVCLRLLFEMLGYKLWLRSTLSPTVMRNTLLSQCFHTQNEKSHKEIFDLFQPFLQSLEALQDGEHEQQRRHFIYFLLHQVNVSRNFSSLMRKKACQIALLIILRGYKMNPPSPPFECAHMWGPSLVSSLKDSSLENSLRRPAFDLIETLIVSDAAALVTSMLNCCKHPSIDQSMIIELDDEEDDDELPFVLDVEEKHSSSWSEYSEQSKITSQDCRRWRCIPMLWLEVLVEINPSVLPISVSKAVFWARSRFALVEPEKNAEMEVPVKNWLSFSAKEISSSFGWKVPTGSDDGGDGKESQNSMKVSTMCIPLIRTFKRLTAHYIVQMEQEELRKQWIWEPRMGESLILLLLEPNDNVRQVGKCLLEQVSNMRGLAHCLQFLCSCTLSMSATYNGLRHALRLVQVDSVLLNFETLHHFFFVLCKLLKEGVICTSDPQRHSSGIKNISKFSSQGGFLRQPAFDSFPENVNGHSSVDDSKSREKFSCLLSEITWPFIRKCLVEGKAFVDYKISQVERREKDSKSRSNVLVIRFYLQNGSSRLNRARKLLIERSKWYLSRVMSITSQLREFHALSSINDIPILPMILKPFNGSLGRSESRKLDPSKLSQPLQRILESSYNSSQLQAISVAIASPDSKKNFDLSLIQGPPGTGKTRTIVAIVSGLLASPLKGVNMKNSVDGSVKQSSIVFTNSRPKMSQSAAVARAWQDAALARQLNEDVEQSLKPMGTSVRQRVLICAQSNAAVDELVSRISSEGLYSSDGNMYKPYLVRVGNVKTVHQNSLPFFIDTLVDQRLVGERMDLTDPKNDLSGDTSALRASLEKLVERIRLYEAKRANLRGKNSELKSSLDDETPRVDDIKETSDAEIEVKLRRLYEQKKEICRDLATAQAQERKANEESKALKHKLRKSILREAEIVVATLSGCGGDLYGVCSESISTHKFGRSSENHLFDAVVIDEAAQALEPATLIPLQLLKSSGTRCIMVGDPKQLPATVLSSVASKFRYQCSMFERLQRAGYPVTMLTKQYRMHPEICRFPSLHFYDSKLLNGENMSSKLAPFHETEGLGPYVFFDVVDGQESHGRNSGTFSLCNEREADAAVEVLRLFRKRHPSEFVGGRIGIITPYKCQLSLLRSRFSSAFGSSITSDMEFNTVDGFQGREVDILVLSTVRAAGPCSAASGINSSSIGFVADVRRMNVALTRAKLSLWILGNARTLQTNCNWAALVKDAKERNLVISAKMPYQSMFKKALKNPSSENSDYSSRQSRHGKTDITSKRAKQNEKNAKEVCERKENSVSSQSQINKRKAGDEHDLSARKEDVQSNKRRASELCDFLAKKKFPSSVVAQRDSSTSKDVKSSTMGNNTDGDGRSKESRERQLHLRSTHLGKGKCTHEISQTNADRSEQEMGDGNKILKPQVLKGTSESLDHGGNQKSMEASTCSAGSILEENDASDRRRALKEVDTAKDVISKRKQQREAVDALLSSALIPSKKSAASLKAAPAKRSLSPALNAGCDINLPKPRKAKQGQIRQHRDKKHRTGDEA
ncbi:uncharacterized protein LOC100265030 isoform X2 [Vitis vinifera]|uniref:uncharacterized protein LOC100265030 isoform X2 n=1 Tax=Vitis vinifera TaxID=29760 RepID=UPI0008FF926D|nr:uncharacterized protein LOC100265030 isoform X2 [Vitis vinifera]|eukprot:XP_019077812.1 PREDICTED: uncharacterized protein LOC100265030 isoform X2 [Vitis vinifera]